MLRSKVRRAVESETRGLRNALAHAMWRDRRVAEAATSVRPAGDWGPVARDGAGPDKPPLERRLEEALWLYRITYLEHLKLNLGGQEARAILFKLVAPALGIAWQLTANHQTLLPRLEGAWAAAKVWLGKLGGW